MRLAKHSAWLTAVAVLVLLSCGDMRQDELDCEEAVSHLASCCPGFDSSAIECFYVSGCTSNEYPAISIPQSQCIRGEDCSRLVTTGVCSRAQDAWPVQADAEPGAEAAADRVCP